MSIRSVDMQHTLQQTSQVERIQALDRGQANQQGQQSAQQLDRQQAERLRTVVPKDDSAESRKVDEEREGKEQGKRRRRPPRHTSAAQAPPVDGLPDGEMHLIDIRV